MELDHWEKLKEKFYKSDTVVIVTGGWIDFSENGMKNVRGGENLSYEEYLKAQCLSLDHCRSYFSAVFYDGAGCYFKGRIERKSGDNVLFRRIMVDGIYRDGTGFYGKEDHVWMNNQGFESYQAGDCLQFSADVYRYLKTGHGKQIDYALEHPYDIKKISSYEVPSDEALLKQSIYQIVCETCLYRDHCYMDLCINPKERENSFNALMKLYLKEKEQEQTK